MTILANITLDEYKGLKKMSKALYESPLGNEVIYFDLVLDSPNQETLDTLLPTLDFDSSPLRTLTLLNPYPTLQAPKDLEGRLFTREVPLEGVPCLASLIEEYPKLYTLRERVENQPNLRFLGGHLVSLEGIPVGRFDFGVAKEYGITGIESKQIYFTPDTGYDFFMEVPFNELNKDYLKLVPRRTTKKGYFNTLFQEEVAF